MLQIQAHEITMTSLELVEFINNQRINEDDPVLLHKNFLAKVPQVLGEETSAKFSADLPDVYGRPRKGYKFKKREACLMAMSYSYDLQAKVFDKMTSLESQKISLPNFSNPVEAARAWADAKEAENSAVLKLESVKPKLEFHAAVTEAINAQSIEEVAKVLGTGRNRMFDWLRSHCLLKADNIPYQEFIDREYFRIILNSYNDNKGESHTYTRTLITGKGLAYIQPIFMAESA